MTDDELRQLATNWARTHNEQGEPLVFIMDWPQKQALAADYLRLLKLVEQLQGVNQGLAVLDDVRTTLAAERDTARSERDAVARENARLLRSLELMNVPIELK